jgi:hypothetical protein
MCSYPVDRHLFFTVNEARNPWAAESPDCPHGHHARDVYRWSYDADDPMPWYCAPCLRRFAVPVPPPQQVGRTEAGTSVSQECPAEVPVS